MTTVRYFVTGATAAPWLSYQGFVFLAEVLRGSDTTSSGLVVAS